MSSMGIVGNGWCWCWVAYKCLMVYEVVWHGSACLSRLACSSLDQDHVWWEQCLRMSCLFKLVTCQIELAIIEHEWSVCFGDPWWLDSILDSITTHHHRLPSAVMGITMPRRCRSLSFDAWGNDAVSKLRVVNLALILHLSRVQDWNYMMVVVRSGWC